MEYVCCVVVMFVCVDSFVVLVRFVLVLCVFSMACFCVVFCCGWGVFFFGLLSLCFVCALLRDVECFCVLCLRFALCVCVLSL